MIELEILPQPDDYTCGPTSLHAVYRHFGQNVSLQELIAEVHVLGEGGTLAVFLGINALKRGYNATICTYNFKEFDPSWKDLEADALVGKLEAQLEFKTGKKFTAASRAYIEFLREGGRIQFTDLTAGLLGSYFRRNIPILTGLSATYLYDCTRERINRKGEVVADDIRGEPAGHFVVLCGLNDKNEVRVADPFRTNPISGTHYYDVSLDRLIRSILLGIITYDANLLVIEPGTALKT